MHGVSKPLVETRFQSDFNRARALRRIFMEFFNKTALKFSLGFAAILAASFLFLILVGTLPWNTARSSDKTAAPIPQEE